MALSAALTDISRTSLLKESPVLSFRSLSQFTPIIPMASGVRYVVNHLPIGFQRFQLTGKRYTLTDGIDSKTYGTGVLVVKHKTDIPQTGSRIDIFPLLRITRQDAADVLHTNQ